MSIRGGLAAVCCVAVMSVSLGAVAQEPRTQQLPRPQQVRPGLMPVDPHAMFDLQRRLQELDQMLSLRSISKAQALLTDLEQHRELAGELLPRRARLAMLTGDYSGAARIARQGLLTRPDDPALWRNLAGSLLALARPDSARLALDGYIAHSRDPRSAGMVAVDLCLQTRHPQMASSLIDSLRSVLGEARFAALQKSQALLETGRKVAAAVEISASLRAQPYNLSLVRSRILQGQYDPDRDEDFLQALVGIADGPGAIAVEKILVANLLLAGGRAAEAVAQVRPLIDNSSAGLTLLQNVNTLTRELDLLPHDRQYTATVDYLLAVLEGLAASPRQGALLQRRAADRLAEVCEQALQAGRLGDDPRAAVKRFNELLDKVRRVNPASDRLYSAQITLARYVRDTLKEPLVAARSLEHLLLDTDLPTEGVALTRLSLGECYLAAGDTARGRVVLTQLARDPDFRGPAGFAHYHLARLDLAEGGFTTARDRFAVVAMDNPGAPYANDALELGLAVAEELDNPSGGPEILGFYAPCVLYDLLDRPDERLPALRTFVRETARRVDLSEPQHLLERGMYELAGALSAADSSAAARRVLRSLYTEHPDSRYAAAAMDQEGKLLLAEGNASAARDIWTRLLVQYPDYLFLPDVRDELKTLAGPKELP